MKLRKEHEEGSRRRCKKAARRNINLTPKEHEKLKKEPIGALDHLDYQRLMSTPTSRKSHRT